MYSKISCQFLQYDQPSKSWFTRIRLKCHSIEVFMPIAKGFR